MQKRLIEYDLPLAQQLDLPLITADAPLARKLAGSGVAVQTLAELKGSDLIQSSVKT